MNPEVVDVMIHRYGQPVTLRRTTGPVHYDVDVTAIVNEYMPNELVGGIQQGDRRVVISNREIAERQWPGPPVQGDKVIINGKTTTLQANPDTKRIGDVIVKHDLRVRGA